MLKILFAVCMENFSKFWCGNSLWFAWGNILELFFSCQTCFMTCLMGLLFEILRTFVSVHFGLDEVLFQWSGLSLLSFSWIDAIIGTWPASLQIMRIILLLFLSSIGLLSRLPFLKEHFLESGKSDIMKWLGFEFRPWKQQHLDSGIDLHVEQN